MKKSISLLLTVLMCLSVFVMSLPAVSAAETTVGSAAALTTAIANASSGDTIVLSAGFTVPSTITVSKQLTIKSASGSIFVVKRSALTSALLVVANGGNLTLENVVLDGADPANTTTNTTNAVTVQTGGTLNLGAGSQIARSRSCGYSTVEPGGVYVNGGTLNMYTGSTIKNCYSNNNANTCGAVYIASNGTFHMYDGALTSGDGRMGAVYVASGSFIMDAGTISGFTSNLSGNGGGVYVAQGASFTMNGGTISGNTAWNVGGGVCNEGTFTMNGGTITGNTSSQASSNFNFGGGVFTAGTMNMTNGNITNNIARLSGGGVYLGGGTFTMSGGTISGNSTQTYSAGGVFVAAGSFQMSGGTITANTAVQFGGGIASTSDASNGLVLSGGAVYGNTCGSNCCGADIYITTANSSSVRPSYGVGCEVYTMYVDNTGARYPGTKTPATSAVLTQNYGYAYEMSGTGHSYGDWYVKTAATCTEDGVEEHVCTVCNQAETRVLVKFGHTNVTTTTPATCSLDGSIVLACSKCGQIHNTTVIPATGHIPSAAWTVLVPATETSDGIKIKCCMSCGVELERKSYTFGEPEVFATAPAVTVAEGETQTVNVTVNIAHNPGIWGMGFYVYYDNAMSLTNVACGNVFTDGEFTLGNYNLDPAEDEVVSALFAEAGLSATGKSFYAFYADSATFDNVTANGTLITMTFEVPGVADSYEIGFLSGGDGYIINADDENVELIFTGAVVEASLVGGCTHEATEWVTTVAATCTVAGTKALKCTECGVTINTEVIPATGHTAGEWVVTTPATCSGAGVRAKYCTVCGALVQTEAITALSHTLGAWETTVAATCTVSGTKVQKCTVCNTVINTDTIPATGHTLGEWVTTVAPTCTISGTKVQKCTVCNAVINTEAIAATGHTLGEWVTTVEATCTVAGERVQKCTVCDDVVNAEVIPALGHDYSTEWTIDVPATATTVGSKSHHCTRCDAKTDITEIPVISAAMKGDITGDSKINALDALRLKLYLNGKITLTGSALTNADITGDGKVNALDSLRLKLFLNGKISQF